MADLDAAIRAKLEGISTASGDLCDELCGDDEGESCAHDGWDDVSSALLAVLDVHACDDRGCCTECRESGLGWDGPVPYPCPTVMEIAKGLGIEVET